MRFILTFFALLEYRPKVDNRVMIEHSSVVIGQVELEDGVNVWPLTVIRGTLITFASEAIFRMDAFYMLLERL